MLIVIVNAHEVFCMSFSLFFLSFFLSLIKFLDTNLTYTHWHDVDTSPPRTTRIRRWLLQSLQNTYGTFKDDHIELGPCTTFIPGKSLFSGQKTVLIVLQIVSMQILHYLTLSIIIPPLLAIFAEAKSLAYEGSAANVGKILLLCCGKLKTHGW